MREHVVGDARVDIRADALLAGWTADPNIRRVLDALPAAVAVVGQTGGILLANRPLAELCGYTADELEGASVEVLVPEAARRSHRHHRAVFEAHPAARPMGSGLDIWCRRKDGTAFPADVCLAPLTEQDATYVLVTLRDDSERRRTEEQLFWDATHDSLTGLTNRRLLLDRLEVAVQRRHRRDLVAVLFVDLDGIKRVNDLYGHAAGDIVLVETARRLESMVRPSDTVARLGGDEFVVLCVEAASKHAVSQMAERFVAVLNEPFDIGHPIVLGASVGVAILGPGQRLNASALLDAADTAMYESKRHGGGRWRQASELRAD